MEIPKELELDWKKALEYGVTWTREYFSKSKIKTAVVGLSGGSDSALTAYILAKAVGSKNVTAMLMPEDGVTPKEDMEDAEKLAKSLGIRKKLINITGMIEKFLEEDPELLKLENRIAYANIKPRVRMILLYKEANKNNGLVVGTDDRSENILGYFTKYGDGGVDINIPEYLYKTQVRKLLEYVSEKERMPVMKKIAGKKPSPNLWTGQTAEDELKVDYGKIDLVLFYLKDFMGKLSDREIAETAGVEESAIAKIKKKEATNRHKNQIPPAPPVNYEIFKNLKFQ